MCLKVLLELLQLYFYPRFADECENEGPVGVNLSRPRQNTRHPLPIPEIREPEPEVPEPEFG
jgi:hypothetical protein